MTVRHKAGNLVYDRHITGAIDTRRIEVVETNIATQTTSRGCLKLEIVVTKFDLAVKEKDNYTSNRARILQVPAVLGVESAAVG